MVRGATKVSMTPSGGKSRSLGLELKCSHSTLPLILAGFLMSTSSLGGLRSSTGLFQRWEAKPFFFSSSMFFKSFDL